MKHKLSELIQKSGTRVSLTDGEREKMQHVLTEYVALKPVRAGETERLQESRGYAFSYVYTFTRKTMAIGLILALLISGGATSYAAETALPGDTLYQVKVSVNEEVRAAFALSTEAKAEWDTERAERRLEEATALAAAGTLTPEIRAELAARFEEHADKAAEEVEALEEEDSGLAVNLATNFEASLDAHDEILGELKEGGKEISIKVREKARRIASIRTRAEGTLAVADTASAKAEVTSMTMLAPEPNRRVAADVDTTMHAGLAERAGARAKSQFKETSALYARVKAELKAPTQTRFEGELKATSEMITTADGMFAADNFAGAFRLYQEAHTKSQKLAVYLKTALRLGIDLDFSSRVPDPTYINVQTGGGTSGSNGTVQILPYPGSEPIQIDLDSSVEHEVEVETHSSDGEAEAESKIRIHIGI